MSLQFRWQFAQIPEHPGKRAPIHAHFMAVSKATIAQSARYVYQIAQNLNSWGETLVLRALCDFIAVFVHFIRD